MLEPCFSACGSLNSDQRSVIGRNEELEFRQHNRTDPSQLMGDAASLLAKDMNNLSVKERDQALHDVHGIADTVEETPEFVKTKLEDLLCQINSIQPKPAFNLALAQSLDYVTNRDFLLMFLRADYFDAPAAARRIVRHFEQKLELFGVDKLTKNITQADLSQDTLDCLYHGFGQMLPVRDRAGREVLILNPSAAPDGATVDDKVNETWSWTVSWMLFALLT